MITKYIKDRVFNAVDALEPITVNDVLKIIEIVQDTCPECWNAKRGCQCWNDE